MDNYTKGAVEEYLERSRKSLLELFNDPSFPQGAVVDIESRLEGIRQSIEKDLSNREFEGKEREIIIKSRVNQSKFRLDILKFILNFSNIN